MLKTGCVTAQTSLWALLRSPLFLINGLWKGVRVLAWLQKQHVDKAEGDKRNHVLECIKWIPEKKKTCKKKKKKKEKKRKGLYSHECDVQPNYLIMLSCMSVSNDSDSRRRWRTDCVQLAGAGREFQTAPAGFPSFKTYPAHIKPPTSRHTYTHTHCERLTQEWTHLCTC